MLQDPGDDRPDLSRDCAAGEPAVYRGRLRPLQRWGELFRLRRAVEGGLLRVPEPIQRNSNQQVDLRQYFRLALPQWPRMLSLLTGTPAPPTDSDGEAAK